MEFPRLNALLLCSFSGSKSIDGTKFNFLIGISFVYVFNKLGVLGRISSLAYSLMMVNDLWSFLQLPMASLPYLGAGLNVNC